MVETTHLFVYNGRGPRESERMPIDGRRGRIFSDLSRDFNLGKDHIMQFQFMLPVCYLRPLQPYTTYRHAISVWPFCFLSCYVLYSCSNPWLTEYTKPRISLARACKKYRYTKNVRPNLGAVLEQSNMPRTSTCFHLSTGI